MSLERLRKQAREGDREAWRALARQSARYNEPLDLKLVLAPWARREELLEACAEALLAGCTLVAGRFSVVPYRGELSWGAECLIEGEGRDRWWGGVGAETQAAKWLYERWFQHAQDDSLAIPRPRLTPGKWS